MSSEGSLHLLGLLSGSRAQMTEYHLESAANQVAVASSLSMRLYLCEWRNVDRTEEQSKFSINGFETLNATSSLCQMSRVEMRKPSIIMWRLQRLHDCILQLAEDLQIMSAGYE